MSGAIAEAVADGTLPGRVWMYANYHCNLECTYCLTESSPTSDRRQLSGERMIEIAREAKELGFTDLGVTGGEPFMAASMPETLATLATILPTVALTNATLFTEARLRRLEPLADLPIKLQISLDSHLPDENDEARGADNFAAVVRAIPKLVERGIGVRIATTIDHERDPKDAAALCALHRDLGVSDDDHLVRPIVRRGRAIDHDQGVVATERDLPAELTITSDGAFWSPFGPTVHEGRLSTDLLIIRSTRPLRTSAEALRGLVLGAPQGTDSTLNIR